MFNLGTVSGDNIPRKTGQIRVAAAGVGTLRGFNCTNAMTHLQVAENNKTVHILSCEKRNTMMNNISKKNGRYNKIGCAPYSFTATLEPQYSAW
jgi:hypothetical protein